MTDTPQWVLDEIQKVKDEGLTELDLGIFLRQDKEPYETIPEEIFELTHLETLIIVGFKHEIPDNLNNLKKLKNLELRGNYTEIPSWISKLDLKTLELWGEYTQIPNELSKLNLESLELHGQYAEIPNWIGKLNLESLDLHGQYTEIPDWISKLRQLKTLGLYGDYNKLPNWTNNFKLERLMLNGQYTEIPDWISKLKPRLLILGGKYNKIPEWIGNDNLKNLKFLMLFGEYTKVPSSIVNLQKLELLILQSKNEVVSPPPAVLGDGVNVDIEAIRQYFTDIASEATSPLYEAKLLIVGQPEAGKTTLARKIVNENAPMPEQKATTRGIDVLHWEFPLGNGENFRVNIWDFGGQEIYKATHQFFLTKDSVYALVVDNRKEDDNLVYWLHAVELLSENSPLLIIKNERDKRVRQLNERQYKERFNNIQDFKDTDLSTNRGLQAIKDVIKKYIQELPHFGALLPHSWLQIREALEYDTRNFVTYDEYLDICAVNDLHDVDKAKSILGYLHNLGVCLHFEDDELLSQFVILKPEWATTAVYAVLDDADIINNYGVFTLNDLKAIWKESAYDNMHHQLLNLMKKFQLCYLIDGTNQYIAPQLLEDNQREYEWDNRGNLMLRYEYEFMPKGIFSRLIVAMHQLIDNNIVWKTGAVLRQDNAYAEIKENYKGNEITIRTRGNNRDGLLFHTMIEIEKLHLSFGRQLKVSKNVPCNCSSCIQDTEPHFYEYSFVVRLSEAHKTVPCPRSLEDVDAQSLIKEIRQPENWVAATSLIERFRSLGIGENTVDWQKQFLWQRQQLDINIHTPPAIAIPATPTSESTPEKDVEKEQLEQEIARLKQDNAQIWRNFWLVLAGIGWFIGQVAIILVPSRINWTWFVVHPFQWGVYALASVIWVCIIWAILDKKNRANIIIGVFVMAAVTILAPLIIQTN